MALLHVNEEMDNLTDAWIFFLATFDDGQGIRNSLSFSRSARDVSKMACMPGTRYTVPISSFVQEVPTYLLVKLSQVPCESGIKLNDNLLANFYFMI